MPKDSVTAREQQPWLPSPEKSFDEQYLASTTSAAIFDRSGIATLEAKGADAERFLQNMLSASVDKLVDGAGTAATFLTNKGKLVAVLRVFREGAGFRIETEAERETPLLEQLSRFIISEDVSLAPAPTEDASISVVGPLASAWAGDALQSDLAGMNHLDIRRVKTPMDVRVIARQDEPSARFDIVGAADAVQSLVDGVVSRGAVIAGDDLEETRRVESGRPRFGVDIDESHMPLEASLDEAIHFDKGCYIGQEYVVRLAHRGQLQKKLVGVRIEDENAPSPPSTVSLGERQVGTLTSARYSPRLRAVAAIGFLLREAFEPGTRVEVASTDGTTSDGIVSSLPFSTD